MDRREIVSLWHINMTSSGPSHDLRSVFPMMIAAGEPYLGASTGKPVLSIVSGRSPEVRAILGEE